MAATTQTSGMMPASRPADWHRTHVIAAVASAAGLLLLVAAYGFDYYSLDAAARVASEKHQMLRPSGEIGKRLGMLGGVLFLLVFLYPLRKRWPWLAKRGQTRHWLNFHIAMGLIAPALITFHSSFKFHGAAGMAYWTMMAVVLSGIVGRYLYAQVPRRLDQAEMSLQEIEAAARQLKVRLESQAILTAEDIEPLFRVPAAQSVQEMPLWRALAVMIWLDLQHLWLDWRLGARAARSHASAPEIREALSAVRRQAALTRRVVFLDKAKRTFHLWHVVHRPFSYSFSVLSLMHVLVVLLLGYY